MAWRASQNLHQLGAAIEIHSRSGPGSDSIIILIRWLSLQIEVATARAEVAGTTTPHSKHAGKEAGVGLGDWKKLIEGNIGDWKLMKRMEINERENDEAVASRAKEKTESDWNKGRCWQCWQCFGRSAADEGLLHLDFYHTLKIVVGYSVQQQPGNG